jgi:hypothetical protein
MLERSAHARNSDSERLTWTSVLSPERHVRNLSAIAHRPLALGRLARLLACSPSAIRPIASLDLQIVQIDGGEEKLVIGAQVSGETAAALRRLAAAGERTLSAEIRIALRKHLDSRRVRVHPPQERKVA